MKSPGPDLHSEWTWEILKTGLLRSCRLSLKIASLKIHVQYCPVVTLDHVSTTCPSWILAWWLWTCHQSIIPPANRRWFSEFFLFGSWLRSCNSQNVCQNTRYTCPTSLSMSLPCRKRWFPLLFTVRWILPSNELDFGTANAFSKMSSRPAARKRYSENQSYNLMEKIHGVYKSS